jgi:hypothetical protein
MIHVIAEEAVLPSGWELVGRIIVVFGLAGLLGLSSRQLGLWLRNRQRRKPK